MRHGRSRRDIGGNLDHVNLISFRVRVGFRLDGRSISRNTAYVLSGVCLIVTILHDQNLWQRYALYCAILVFSLCLSVCLSVCLSAYPHKTRNNKS